MGRHRWWIAAGLIVAATVGVYWNTLDNGFVNWDDPSHIYENELIIGDGGLAAIWLDVFAEKPHRHYYPLAFTTLWLEYRLVGFEPPLTLYHVDQFLLHALNAVLLLFLLRMLGVTFRPAALTSALFALHPVNVASVTWITERKNTLSGVFFFLTLMIWLRFRERGGGWRYGLALGCFALAILSKSAVLMLAPILVLTDRLLDGRFTRGALVRSAPFFALGATLALVTSRIEAVTSRSGEPAEIWLRPLIAARGLVHYVWKLLWPAELLPIYPRYPETLAWWPYWASLGLVLIGAGLIWRYRETLGDRLLWALASFVLLLFPMMGFKHFSYLQSSFVSDHFVYLSMPWLMLVLTSGLAWATRRRPAVFVGVAVVVLGLCSAATVAQNRVWHDPGVFWAHTLKGNPGSLAGRLNLGNHLRRQGDCTGALVEYREAARIDGRYPIIHLFIGRCEAANGRFDAAVTAYRTAIAASRARSGDASGMQLELGGLLEAGGRPAEALIEYEEVLAAYPEHDSARAAAARLR